MQNPSVSFRVSRTPYALGSIFTISLTSVMFLKKVLQFYFFSNHDVLFGCIPQPWYHGGVHQGADRENFRTALYLRIHSTKKVSFIYAMLMLSGLCFQYRELILENRNIPEKDVLQI